MKACLLRIVALLVALEFQLLGAIAAGQEAEVLFEDDFAMLDPSLGVPDQSLEVKDNTLIRRLPGNYTWKGLYQSFVFDDADISLKVRLPQATPNKSVAAGLAFWARDYSDFYTFEILENGNYRVGHLVGGRWLFPVPVRRCEPLNADLSQWSELRVVTLGRHATFYVNGQKLVSLVGDPPSGGGTIGPYLETWADAGAAEYASLKVVVPADAAPVLPPQDPDVLFADDFSALDPAWGESSESRSAIDGRFVFKLLSGHNSRQLYEGRLFGDADMRVTARLVDADDDATADLMFWANGYNDHYMLSVANNGTFAVYRWVKDRWLTPLASRKHPGLEYDLREGVEIRVSTQGNSSSTA
ncbi:MAG: DUF1080 domain-containing protein [Planctomycetes bacterium]|nr:DUF1080 domain-containing protein [Planctomycetota bacterium]